MLSCCSGVEMEVSPYNLAILPSHDIRLSHYNFAKSCHDTQDQWKVHEISMISMRKTKTTEKN